MYTPAALLDVHERGHRSIRRLLEHCAGLSEEEWNREIEGFGYPSVRRQMEHAIGAEEYWISVIRGLYSGQDFEPASPDARSLEAHRRRVFDTTAAFLRGISERELNAPREVKTWTGATRSLVPAHVLMRTFSHLYQHQGQVLAMCRLMGHPGPETLDFPLD